MILLACPDANMLWIGLGLLVAVPTLAVVGLVSLIAACLGRREL